MQFLFIRLPALEIRIRTPSMWSFAHSSLCRLRRHAQKRFHWKWFGQIGQGVKIQQAAWAYPDGGKHHHREFLAVTIDLLWAQPSFTLGSAQYLPAGLIRQVDIQHDKIKLVGLQLGQCALAIGRNTDFVLAHLEVAFHQVAYDLVVFDH